MWSESICLDEEFCLEFRKKNLIVKDYDEKIVITANETGPFLSTLQIKLCMKQVKYAMKAREVKSLCFYYFVQNKCFGDWENPRWATGIKSCSLDYEANRKSWMTSNIFENWLNNLNKKEMKTEKRRFFIDNCVAHSTIHCKNFPKRYT